MCWPVILVTSEATAQTGTFTSPGTNGHKLFAISNHWHRFCFFRYWFTHTYKLLSLNNHTENKWFQLEFGVFKALSQEFIYPLRVGKKKSISWGFQKVRTIWKYFASSKGSKYTTHFFSYKTTNHLFLISWGVTHILCFSSWKLQMATAPSNSNQSQWVMRAPSQNCGHGTRCSWDKIFQMVSVGGLGWGGQI